MPNAPVNATMTIPARELEALFDALPDVVFFVKDREGRYTHANLTLVGRLGLKRRSDVVGRHVTELFPAELGRGYAAQDRRVLEGEFIEDQLEVHIFPSRQPGWCLTCKRPLRSQQEISGLVGISRDLSPPDGRHPTYDRLRRALGYLQQHYAGTVRMQTLAGLADLSVEAAMRLLGGKDSVAAIGVACGFADQSAFARRFKATVGMTPRAYRGLLAG
jgi:PAS fold/Helix-turn-helix domain